MNLKVGRKLPVAYLQILLGFFQLITALHTDYILESSLNSNVIAVQIAHLEE